MNHITHNLHLLPNAHLDPVWLWDWREGLNESLTTCQAVLGLMDRDPELTFNRGEAAIYEHIARTDPAMFSHILHYIKLGRWDLVGGTYIQADENLPDTETLIRQYLRGVRYFADTCGKNIEVGWSADCFGHAAGLPDLLAAAGLRYFCCTRPSPGDLSIAKSAFWWQGCGGSRILTYRPNVGWYGTERDEVPQRLDQIVAQAQTEGLTNIGVLFGLGNHGGGPTARQIADVRQWAAQHPECRVIFSTMHRFFNTLQDELQKRSSDFIPTHRGEMNFTMRGCYSSMARFKFQYRTAQACLRRAEATDAAVAVQLQRCPADMKQAWDAVLFNAFHDILPGSSIERTYDDQAAWLGGAVHAAQATELNALNALAETIDTRVATPMRPDMPTGVSMLLWNPLPRPYEGLTEIEACLDYRPIAQYRHRVAQLPMRLLDHAGQPLPFQLVTPEHRVLPELALRMRVAASVRLPPMGWTVLDFAWDEQAPAPASPQAMAPVQVLQSGAIDNGLLSVQAAVGGRGIVVTHRGQPLVRGGGLSAATFSDPWGSWGSWADASQEPAAAHITELLEPWQVAGVRTLEAGPWRAALWVRLAGRSSHLDLTLRLSAGQEYVEVLARVLWNEHNARLKLLMPSGSAADFEVPGGYAHRGPVGEVPGGRWCRVYENGKPVLGLVSDALSNFSIMEDTLSATIVRASGYAQSDKAEADTPWLPTFDRGELRFRFLLTPGLADLAYMAQMLAQPVMVLPVKPSAGAGSRTGSVLRLEPTHVQLLAFKPAADSPGWIIRLLEVAGCAAHPELTLLGRVVRLDLLGPHQLGTWRLDVTAEGITAVRCDIVERPLH